MTPPSPPPLGHPFHVEAEPLEAGQIEILAHLPHQADGTVDERAGGEGHRKARTTHVRDLAIHRPVRGRTNVPDEDQIGRPARPGTMVRLSGMRFLVPHLAFSPGVHNRQGCPSCPPSPGCR
jgi:hypothetical protein